VARANAVVRIEKVEHVREAGHRTKAVASRTVLYEGPARLSAPSRTWERVAALEGTYAGRLNVQATAALGGANAVTILRLDGAAELGEYDVVSVSSSGFGWGLSLGRRKVAA